MNKSKAPKQEPSKRAGKVPRSKENTAEVLLKNFRYFPDFSEGSTNADVIRLPFYGQTPQTYGDLIKLLAGRMKHWAPPGTGGWKSYADFVKNLNEFKHCKEWLKQLKLFVNSFLDIACLTFFPAVKKSQEIREHILKYFMIHADFVEAETVWICRAKFGALLLK